MRHGGVSAVVCSALGTYGAGGLADVTAWDPLHAGLTAGAATLGVAAATSIEHLPAFARGYLTAATAAAGGWITYAAATTPWWWEDPTAASLLAAAATGLGALYPAARRALRRRPPTAATPAVRPAAPTRGWSAALALPELRGVEQISQQHTRYGETLRWRLPANGRVTLSTLQTATERIKVAADLGRRWLLEFTEGDTAREVIVTALSPAALTQNYELPLTSGPTSINDPFDIGMRADGRACMVLFREIAGLLAGVRGSGKTNLLNVFLARLTQTCDAVIWYIDIGKRGKAARPWLAPYMAGDTTRPVLDWVATTEAEAHRMLRAFVAAIQARTQLLEQPGDAAEKITPSPDLPAIILVIDEAPSIFGEEDFRAANAKRANNQVTNADLVELATEGVRTGRSEAVDLLMAAQRITNSMVGGGDLKSQIELRVGLYAPNGMDLSLVFPHDAVDARKLVSRGCMYVAQDGAPVVAKGYRIPYGQIAGIAAAHTAYRPALDAATAAALGEDYAYRWHASRAFHLRPDALTTSGGPGGRGQLTGATAGDQAAGDPPPVTQEPPTTAGHGGPGGLDLGPDPDFSPTWHTPAGDPIPRPGDPHQIEAGHGELERRFQAAVSGWDTISATRVPAVLERVAGVFARTGAERLHTETILDALGIPELSPHRLRDMLGTAGVRPHKEPFIIDGRRGRGYRREDVLAAVAAVRHGQLTPPDSAFTWPPETPPEALPEA